MQQSKTRRRMVPTRRRMCRRLRRRRKRSLIGAEVGAPVLQSPCFVMPYRDFDQLSRGRAIRWSAICFGYGSSAARECIAECPYHASNMRACKEVEPLVHFVLCRIVQLSSGVGCRCEEHSQRILTPLVRGP
jgi:hypothetical protein